MASSWPPFGSPNRPKCHTSAGLVGTVLTTHDGPRWPQDRPRHPQDPPRPFQVPSKMPQGSPKDPPNDQKSTQDTPQTIKNRTKTQTKEDNNTTQQPNTTHTTQLYSTLGGSFSTGGLLGRSWSPLPSPSGLVGAKAGSPFISIFAPFSHFRKALKHRQA